MAETKLGRDVIFDYLRAAGVDHLFGVPGTNEIPIIDGTNVASNQVVYVPCLHENIAVGAAMGWARATGKPGVVELHITPGAAHGIGNLYNAYKSHIPLVVLCAQQHNELVLQEPILASDLVQVARQYTKWSYEVRTPNELGLVMQRAFKEAMAAPQRPVFVAIPWEFTLAEVADVPAQITRVATGFVGDAVEVQRAAETLAAAHSPIVIVGDGVGAAGAWGPAEEIATLLGAPVYSESLGSYMNFPNHSPLWQGELPTNQPAIQKVFQDEDKGILHDVAFLCGYNAQAQIVAFDYSLGPMIPADVACVYLHDDEWEIGKNGYGEVAILGDIAATLPVLRDALAAHPHRDDAAAKARTARLHELGSGRKEALRNHAETLSKRAGTSLPTGDDIAVALAALQSDMSAPLVLVNEAVSDAGSFESRLTFDEPTSYFFAEGGSLGYSMPAALGFKAGAGASRTVVNVIGDGSTLFYPHAWWTATKLQLPILYVIVNNREYRTLLEGLELVETLYKWQPSGDPWYLRLDDPAVNFVAVAASFGVEGAQVSTIAGLGAALSTALDAVKEGRPYVVEVLTDPSLPVAGPPPRLDTVMADKEGKSDERQSRIDRFGPA